MAGNPLIIAVATQNAGKVAEYRALLGDLPVTVRSLTELGVHDEVEERGATYAENALLKARAAAQRLHLLAVADDSGLEVDALDGAPGLHSKRWTGGEDDDGERNKRLLERLEGLPPERRSARFVCVLAAVRPDGATALTRGELRGRILEAPRGTQGFGYDPIFLASTLDRTIAELAAEEKNRWSHRARACAAALPLLRWLLDP